MNDWFVPLAAGDGMPLYAFPQAGAGCAQLVGLAKAAAARGVSVRSANLPGRQARIAEPPITDFDTLTRALADALAESLDGRPYGLVGHCGGAMVAYGVLRLLAEQGKPLPRHFVVMSADAPDIALRPSRIAALPSDRLWTYLVSTGGAPPGIASDERMRALLEPAIRADFTLLGGYRYRQALPLPVPITVCYGERDEEIRRGGMLGWRRQTTHTPVLHVLDAGNRLLDEAVDELADLLAEGEAS